MFKSFSKFLVFVFAALGVHVGEGEAAAPKRTAHKSSVVAKKAAPVKRKVVAKKAAPVQRKVVAKKAAPVQRKVVAKKAAPVKRKVVAKKAAPVKRKVVAKKAAPVKRKVVAKKAAPVQRKVVAKKAAPVKRTAAARPNPAPTPVAAARPNPTPTPVSVTRPNPAPTPVAAARPNPAPVAPLPLSLSEAQEIELENFANQPLQKKESQRIENGDLTGRYNFENLNLCDLGFPLGAETRSEQYRIGMPKAPIFHPYNPGRNLTNYLTPTFSLNAKVPFYHPSFVPESVRNILRGVEQNIIEMFIEVQDVPWNTVAAPLLLRPQSWLDPNAPFEDRQIYSKSFQIETGVFTREPSNIKIVGQDAAALKSERGISVHNTIGPIDRPLLQDAKAGRPIDPKHRALANNLLLLDRARTDFGSLTENERVLVRNLGWKAELPNLFGDPQLVSSSATLPIAEFDFTKSNELFSVTKYNGRYAVVQHLLLNEQDNNVFLEILNRADVTTLSSVKEKLNQPEIKRRLSPSGQNIFEKFTEEI